MVTKNDNVSKILKGVAIIIYGFMFDFTQFARFRAP